MILKDLHKNNLITPPPFLIDNTIYLVTMGSHAYGINKKDSDFDLYGATLPPKEIIFPHLAGEIYGFDMQTKRFEQYEQHHVMFKEKEYDVTVFNIVKYFYLATVKGSPNVIDSLFVPANCVRYISTVGNMIRDNRRLFLSKKLYHTYRGYSYSQKHKMQSKTFENSKRKEEVEKHGFCVKYASHLVRLLNQIEQILTEEDLDLQRHREQLKSIRRGEWTIQQIEDYFTTKDKILENLYNESSLPYSPREKEIKQLLLDCLEHHYGSLDKAVVIEDKHTKALRDIKKIIDGVL